VSGFRIELFQDTVARPDFQKPGQWLLMNHPEKGYGSYCYGPFPSLETITERFAVQIGDLGADRHGATVRMVREPGPHCPKE
jgi:hypothetical protein